MLKRLFTGIFGTRHDREVKRLQPLVAEINEIAERLQSLSEEELKGQTEKLRAIVRERTSELEERLAELRERRSKTEDPDERESIVLELREVEDALKERSEEHTSELQSRGHLVCRRLLEQNNP